MCWKHNTYLKKNIWCGSTSSPVISILNNSATQILLLILNEAWNTFYPEFHNQILRNLKHLKIISLYSFQSVSFWDTTWILSSSGIYSGACQSSLSWIMLVNYQTRYLLQRRVSCALVPHRLELLIISSVETHLNTNK